MKITKENKEVRLPNIIKLGDVKPGQIIRFATDSEEDSFSNNLFYIRIESTETKQDRVRLVEPVSGKQIERDSVHHVIVHEAKLSIYPV